MSGDGRIVAFQSRTKLVSGDTNGASDIYVHDLGTGLTDLISVARDGTAADDDSGEASISSDGRYVAFWSEASNLVSGDGNGVTDAFVRDLATGVTERVSVASDGGEGDDEVARSNVSISAEGRFTAFASEASNLVPGDTNDQADVFVHDRSTGTTERISVASDGGQATSGSFHPSLSADGRHVAFFSFSPALVAEDTNSSNDIFVHDRATGVTERISVANDGSEANGHSYRDPSISADGRHVAFYSVATNLVPGDTNGAEDVFVRDRQTGRTERVSVASDGTEGDGNSLIPSISADGRHVVFHSAATNLVAGDTNGFADTFVHDRVAGSTERVSISSEGEQGNGNAHGWASVSADGSIVAFHAVASNLVPDDTNGEFGFDMFVRRRGPPTGVLDLAVSPVGDSVVVTGSATFSGSPVATVTDAADDGLPGAAASGAELTGANVVHRPESEDLLVRLEVDSLPGLAPGACAEGQCLAASSGAGGPGVVYGLAFTIGGTSYEVRGSKATGGSVPPATPHFALYRCEVVCVEMTKLRGAIGTIGSEVRIAVPLAALAAPVGSVTGVRGFAGAGDAGAGVAALDDVAIPDVSVEAPIVSLATAPAGTSPEDLSFETEVTLSGGGFAETVDLTTLPEGDHDVWVRACLGASCSSEKRPISVS